MKLVTKAVRAIVVETLGVLLVLWLLFGTALWSIQPPRDTARGPSLGEALALPSPWTALADQIQPQWISEQCVLLSCVAMEER